MSHVVTTERQPAMQEAGMPTAEYAAGTVATWGLGGLLYQLLTSDTGLALLRSVYRNALGPVLG